MLETIVLILVGIASLSYSSNKAPYGFPVSKDKWRVESFYQSIVVQSSPAAQFYNLGGCGLNLPIGSWSLGHDVHVEVNHGSASTSIYAEAVTSLSTSTTALTSGMEKFISKRGGNNTTAFYTMYTKEAPWSNTAQTQYYFIAKPTASTAITFFASNTPSSVYADCGYL